MLIHRVGGQDAGEVIKVRPRTWGRAVACLGCGAKAACAHSYCKRTVADVPPTRVAAPGASRRINNTLPIGSPKRLRGYQERIGAGLVPVGMGVLAGVQLMSPAWRERLRVRAAHYGATSVPGSKVSFDGGAVLVRCCAGPGTRWTGSMSACMRDVTSAPCQRASARENHEKTSFEQVNASA
jgi:hypothetical protein